MLTRLPPWACVIAVVLYKSMAICPVTGSTTDSSRQPLPEAGILPRVMSAAETDNALGSEVRPTMASVMPVLPSGRAVVSVPVI